MAHYNSQEYDKSIEDYHVFTAHTKKSALSVPEFSLAFAQGLPKGIHYSANGQKNITLAKELGFSTKEMVELKQAGRFEGTVNNAFENILKDPILEESFKKFKKAEEFLKLHKGYMPEEAARNLIHEMGIKTFPRPKGIPENFRVKLSKEGAGMKYVHPQDEGTYIRVMPGKPYSPNLCQRKPYVSHLVNGNYVDKFGNVVSRNSPESHIPIEEFVYKGN